MPKLILKPFHTLRSRAGLGIAVTLLSLLALPASSLAQATRTWVSGVGDDANPCSRTAPCKTFAGAISKTAAGGEIDALDPGGYGGLTITKSITIDGGGGQVASTLVSGTNGMVVQGAPTDRVIIRNLRFEGLYGNGGNPGAAGVNGIQFKTGQSLTLENVDISGFAQNGVDFENSQNNATLFLTHVTIENVGGNGVNFFAPATGQKATIDDSTIQAASGAGVRLSQSASGTPSRMTLVNTRVDQNGCGVAAGTASGSPCWAPASGNPVLITAVDSSASDSYGAGILAVGGGTIAIGNDVVTGNGLGLAELSGGTIASYGNNQVISNGTDGSANMTATGKNRDVWAYVKRKARNWHKRRAANPNAKQTNR